MQLAPEIDLAVPFGIPERRYEVEVAGVVGLAEVGGHADDSLKQDGAGLGDLHLGWAEETDCGLYISRCLTTTASP